MDQETIFRNQLNELVKTARKQGMYLSEEQIKEAFPELSDTPEKLSLVSEYLKNVHVTVGAESALEQFLSDEDRNYLEQYLEEVQKKAEISEKEKREIMLEAMEEKKDAAGRLLEIYLPNVAEIAKLYTGQGVPIEDLIGEGNVALTAAVHMLSCLENVEEVDGFLGKFMMDAMEKFLQDEEASMDVDEKVVEKVNEIAKAAKELAEELRRKVTIAELAEETEYSIEEIDEAVRISANQIEDIEVEKWN